MGHMELCCIMDQHEFVYPYIYAGQFTYRWWNELVAGCAYDLYWQYRCVDPNDIERTCRCQIWYPISCFCESKFWNNRCKHSGDTKSHRCMWMVWYSNMDRRICHLPD